ncbi:hemolysin family protein [Nocardioides sp.]|uniref:hemolysin family protein n=1 Tax=Nocardioides sp. TaxID=35761 RepID=UPI00263A0377|nr:hemolysin family protein [Nocardioides sp.]
MTDILLLLSALALVALCGVFVAAEFALVTVDRASVDTGAEQGIRGAAGVKVALTRLSTHLSGAQLGITLTNLGIGFLAEPAVSGFIPSKPAAVAVGLIGSTILTMVFGELVPKNIALSLPLGTALRTQRFLRVFTAINAAPIRLLNGSANALVRRLGIEPQEELRSARSSTELASLIQRSADEGVLDADAAELMERSVEFGTRTAGEIMTPRMRTYSVDDNARAAAVIELTRRTGHSRFPVLDDEGHVVGTVHVKNAVALPLHERSTTRVKHLMAKPVVVPDTLRLDPLLALLRREGFQLAVVLDEYGGQAGIVTLEDVIEEIVGDIADEHDSISAQARLRRDGSWSISGLLRPDEVEDLTGVALPEGDDYDTIGGLVMRVLGAIPTKGDVAEVEIPDRSDPDEPRERLATLTVEHMDGLRVDRVGLRFPVVAGPEVER